MAIIPQGENLESYNNGTCSGCGNGKSIVFWSGKDEMGFCPVCCEYILTHLLGDYIYATKHPTLGLKEHTRNSLNKLTIQIQDAIIIQCMN